MVSFFWLKFFGNFRHITQKLTFKSGANFESEAYAFNQGLGVVVMLFRLKLRLLLRATGRPRLLPRLRLRLRVFTWRHVAHAANLP